MRFAITRRGVALAEIERPAGSAHGYDIERRETWSATFRTG
jgi:hypothetical protein